MIIWILQQYGGFYKHQVESALNSPERLFHLMGYASSGQQSLVLEGPVELDKVTVAARDCLLAFMECQVRSIFLKFDRRIIWYSLAFMECQVKAIFGNLIEKIICYNPLQEIFKRAWLTILVSHFWLLCDGRKGRERMHMRAFNNGRKGAGVGGF